MQSLPEDGPVDNRLPQIEGAEGFDNDDDDSEDTISRQFVPAPIPSPNEECAISNTLNRMQANTVYLILCGQI